MKQFFGRHEELKELRLLAERSKCNAQFTVVSGSRRIGKTTLVKEAFSGDEPMLYFYVGKKAEGDLCEIYCHEVEEKLGIPVQVTSFCDLFRFLMKLSKTRHITLFVDEFQRLAKINASIYSDMQDIWDQYKGEARINLIVGGSAKSMLLHLFEGGDEPLFGRQTGVIHLSHFCPSELKEILSAYSPDYTNEDLLALYSITGGVARYVEILLDAGAYTRDKMIDEIIRMSSIFVAEGRNHLFEEFGSESAVYFTILTSIATGHSERGEIEAAVGKGVGGQLSSLEDAFEVIKKHVPLFATNRKNIHYRLEDSFYVFWFRFIYKYNYLFEIKAHEKLREIILRDFDTFSGKCLERYFYECMVERKAYTRIGGWWNRKGDVDIDLIAVDELGNRAEFYEIKRNENAYDASLLIKRKDEFLQATHQLVGYDITTSCLSLKDM